MECFSGISRVSPPRFQAVRWGGCPIKKLHPNNFSRGSPSATLILNSMFVVGVLYCAKLLPEVANFQTFLLPFSSAKAFFFYFLSSILVEFQKCPFSQNKYAVCLIKAQLKNCTQTIFQGGSPSATLILNSMFVVVVLYCFKLLSEVKIFKHAFYLFPLLKLFFYLAPSCGNHNQKLFPKDELQPAKKKHEWPWYSLVCLLCGSSIASSF